MNRLRIAIVLSVFACACADWMPVHNVSEIPPGHALKIPTSSGTDVVVSHLMACDTAGVIVARATPDCSCKDPACTFDLRISDIRVHRQVLSPQLSIVAAIVAALLVVAIVFVAET